MALRVPPRVYETFLLIAIMMLVTKKKTEFELFDAFKTKFIFYRAKIRMTSSNSDVFVIASQLDRTIHRSLLVDLAHQPIMSNALARLVKPAARAVLATSIHRYCF